MEVTHYQPVNESNRLIRCQTCGMYQFFSFENNVWLERHFTVGSSIKFTCFACHEKSLLLKQINDQSNTISKLQERIISLQAIRDLENEIDDFDRTVNINIDHNLDLGGHGESTYSTNSTIDNLNFTISSDVPLPVHTITIAESNQTAHSTADQSCLTSVWNSSTNESQNLNDVLSTPSTPDSTTSKIFQLPTSFTNPVVLNDGSHGSVITENQIETVNNFGPGDADLENRMVTHSSDSVNHTSNLDALSSIRGTIEKADSNVSCVFAGDGTIRNVSPFLADSKSKCYKVSRPGASAANLRKTLKYLLETRHKLAKTVLLQVGSNDISNRLTEEVKLDFKLLAEDFQNNDRRLLISGPVPSYHLNSEQFTRTLHLNDWLKRWADTEQLCFIDNFDLFWKKKHLFKRNGKGLNDLGSMVLTYNIRTAFSRAQSL